MATIFAPNDAAFADLLTRLGVSAGEALGAASTGAAFHTDPVDQIILRYHIVPGMAVDVLKDGQILPTLNDGQTLRVSPR